MLASHPNGPLTLPRSLSAGSGSTSASLPEDDSGASGTRIRFPSASSGTLAIFDNRDFPLVIDAMV
jgi:hypothetical protein